MRHFCRLLLVAFVLLALGARALYAQPDTTRWTPELTMQYDQITETEISPGGGHVAYVVREAVMDQTTSTYRQQIHVAATDGSSDVQYTRGEHSSFHPRWSPSGDRIAFLSARGGPPQVYLMRLRGGEPYRVSDAETGVRSFQWGPDGEQIAYTMTDPKSKAEKRREREKRDVQIVNQEARHRHLYTTGVRPARDTARTVQRLTRGDFRVAGFDWAPDGETIVFARRPTPWGVDASRRTELYTVPADSGSVNRLTNRPGREQNPRYHPGGTTIAFEGSSAPVPFSWDIYTVPVAGGASTALPATSNRDVEDGLVGWTAGSKRLLVRDVAGTSTHVYAVSAENDSVRQVTTGAGAYATVSYSRGADRLALTYQNSRVPAEVCVSPRRGFERRRLTTVNTDVPKTEMGRTELVTWTGPEGREIEALLTYPVEYDGGRVPLVIFVHGGPLATHLRRYSAPEQIFAQRGYAVLRPNPRGSSGYGRAFREAVIENWGPGPFQDLMAGVDTTIEQRLAHPDSLAIWGPSYGGYMTAYAVTQTDRFEAASMVAGSSNLISLTGTNNYPKWNAINMGGEFWNRYEIYERQSPIYHVKDVATPTLVLHGAEDDNVPPSQGREFYRALRRLGVPTEFVLYPRMGHGPSEPKQAMDIFRRMMDWFDEHLGRSPDAASDSASSSE